VTAIHQDACGEIGDPIPHRGDQIGRRGDPDRDIECVGIIEKQEEHDALPVEIEGEVAEREQRQPSTMEQAQVQSSSCLDTGNTAVSRLAAAYGRRPDVRK
jgi:hypothetical protein